MKRPKDVDAYITGAPKEIQGKLREMRATIKKSAPGATEKISYGMPYYGHKGRLAYFAYSTNHIGLYIPPPIIQDFKKELHAYGTAVSTIRFPLDEKLPITLIKRLIRARVKYNEEHRREK